MINYNKLFEKPKYYSKTKREITCEKIYGFTDKQLERFNNEDLSDVSSAVIEKFLEDKSEEYCKTLIISLLTTIDEICSGFDISRNEEKQQKQTCLVEV